MNYLREPHTFRHNDAVSISLRKNPEIRYEGVIYSIVNRSLQRGVANSPNIDYFYVTLDPSVYHSILLPGWSVIYQGKERVLSYIERGEDGKITGLYSNAGFGNMMMDEMKVPIKMEDIYAILIWRVAYQISKRDAVVVVV